MKQKLLLVIFTAMTCLLSISSHAQTRYQDSIFASYTLDSVTYSSVTGFKMDIYQPAGDVAATRPVVLLVHGGTFVSGTREDDTTVVRLCRDLVHKGYVTVSIDYTLANPITNMLDSNLASLEVFQAIADARAAVRYLYMDAATSNTYRVDTTNIFIGGNSAGAVLAMHYAYVTNIAQFGGRLIFLNAVDSIGGTLMGNRGNAGYNSGVKGVISLSGGLNEANWMSECGPSLVGAHGTGDVIVPYTCGYPFVFGFATVPLQLCGLGSYSAYLPNVPFSSTIAFPGAGHVPWDTNAQMYYQVDTLVTGFLYNEVSGAVANTCTNGATAGIQNVSNASNITLYPNPASYQVNIQSSTFMTGITVLDETGRTVSEAADLHSLSYQLNTANLSSGIYFVRIDCGQATPTVRKVTIE